VVMGMLERKMLTYQDRNKPRVSAGLIMF
jgi:hypothetical protein